MVNNRISEDCIVPVSAGSLSTECASGVLVICGYTTNRIYKSTDNGDTWDAGYSMGAGVQGITQLANGWLLAVSFSNPGKVFKSTDYGDTWDAGVPVATYLSSIRQLANGNIVCISGVTNKIFTSTDNGATWDAGVAVGSGAGLQQVLQLANGDVVVTAYSSQKIYKSADNGATWDAGVTVPQPPSGVCQLPNGDLLCAGTDKVFKSTDNGATWDAGTSATGVNSRLYYSDGFVYASSLQAGTYRSADLGATWDAVGATTSTRTDGLVLLASLEPRAVSVPAGASGVILQCSSTTGEAYWRTDSTSLVGFRLRSWGKPTVLRFDPSQTTTFYLCGTLGSTVNYMFIA
jgi:photosystem II stability/assembly factor-like uncharacterized protein